jgi:hypothetical protein
LRYLAKSPEPILEMEHRLKLAASQKKRTRVLDPNIAQSDFLTKLKNTIFVGIDNIEVENF